LRRIVDVLPRFDVGDVGVIPRLGACSVFRSTYKLIYDGGHPLLVIDADESINHDRFRLIVANIKPGLRGR
jgi:hypothetical protein